MRKFLLLLAVVLSYASFGQVISVYLNSSQPIITQCQNQLPLLIGTGNTADLITVSINWGDGSPIEDTIFASTPGQYYFLYFPHQYTTTGAHLATYTVNSQVLGADFVSNESVDFVSTSSTFCGYVLSTGIFQQNPNITYSGVPLDFIGDDGTITTILPLAGSFSYSGLDVTNAPYLVNVNPDWLLNNELSQVSEADTIIGFLPTGRGYTDTSWIELEVECLVASLNPNVDISYGWAFGVAPLQTGVLSVSFCNIACQNATNAEVEISVPNFFIPDITGLSNASFISNEINFDLLNLSDCQLVQIPFTFSGSIPAGTQICFPVSISAIGDTDLSNNIDTICGIILNSYDPNDKQVNQPSIISPDVQETFVYQVRFQNDGNFPAVNVLIRDTLSTNLDISTFTLLESSHSVSASVNPMTREVTFSFNAIWLEESGFDLAASQGYVVYEIKEANGLGVGDQIENTAHIFFDLNPAIITNTTINTNEYEASIDKMGKTGISIYPNPASTDINFLGEKVLSVVVYDLTGKQMFSKNIINNSLSLNSLSNGVYFMEMETQHGVHTQKISVNR